MLNSTRAGLWDIFFRRELRVWENEQFIELRQRLQGVMIDPEKPNKLLWKWLTDWRYFVKSAYGQWEAIMHQSSPLLSSLWKNLAPFKVEIFARMVVKVRIITMSALLNRKMLNGVEMVLCPMCSSHLEIPNHLMLHCRFCWTVWSLILDR